MTPAARRLRARIGGLALAAQRAPRDYTRAARAAFLARFERQVDPAGVLPPEERARRAEAARRLYFACLGATQRQGTRENEARRARRPAKGEWR